LFMLWYLMRYLKTLPEESKEEHGFHRLAYFYKKH